MVLKVFSVHDVKAGYFMPPFLLPTVGHAVRAMKDVASDPATTLARHPADFALYQIGEWDDATAKFVQDEMVFVGPGTSFVPPVNGELFGKDA